MSESSVEPVVELQEVGRVSDLSALSLRERRECWPVAVIARREEWPTSQLTQRICLQQQGMSQQMVEVGLAAVGEDLQAVAEALHTCQAAHAQPCLDQFRAKFRNRSCTCAPLDQSEYYRPLSLQVLQLPLEPRRSCTWPRYS
ncbi:uncharacterized protein LOC142559710 isoform X2 [Dermacentor variabilis]|uniref:uncharacterized protein LOC142559710 isoform X2 n=1 Tax=Dermacentor variabilis TaxID=34621 RepID=UPI003F5B2AF2